MLGRLSFCHEPAFACAERLLAFDDANPTNPMPVFIHGAKIVGSSPALEGPHELLVWFSWFIGKELGPICTGLRLPAEKVMWYVDAYYPSIEDVAELITSLRRNPPLQKQKKAAAA